MNARTLDQVLITNELASRPARTPDTRALDAAVLDLTRQMAASPSSVLQNLADTALRLCRAQTVGISILENENGEPVFRWRAMSGTLAAAIGSAMKRNDSPCGMVLDSNTNLLFSYPELHFPFPGPVNPPIREVLLVPFHDAHGVPVGTIWVVAHEEGQGFDAEDVRIVTELAAFATTARRMLVSLGYVQHLPSDK